MTRVEALLEELIEEIRGLRRDLETREIMSPLSEVIEAVQGLGGELGYNLQDLHDKLTEISENNS